MVGQQAIAEEPERITLLRVGQREEEGIPIVGISEDVLAVVSPVEDVIDEAILDRSRKSSYPTNLHPENKYRTRENLI